MNIWDDKINPAFWHAVGALGLQAASAWLGAAAFGGSIFEPAYAWAGAVVGAGFFALREVWQCRRATPPVWFQKRTPFDVLTVALPVLAAALIVECI